MPKPDDLLYDKRLLDRHVARGLVSEDQRDAHLKGLPDVMDRAAPLVAELVDVGVKHGKRVDDDAEQQD